MCGWGLPNWWIMDPAVIFFFYFDKETRLLWVNTCSLYEFFWVAIHLLIWWRLLSSKKIYYSGYFSVILRSYDICAELTLILGRGSSMLVNWSFLLLVILKGSVEAIESFLLEIVPTYLLKDWSADSHNCYGLGCSKGSNILKLLQKVDYDS